MTPEIAVALEVLEQVACKFTESEHDHAQSEYGNECQLTRRAHEAALEQASAELRAAAFDYVIAVAVSATRVPWPLSGSSPANLVRALTDLKGRTE